MKILQEDESRCKWKLRKKLKSTCMAMMGLEKETLLEENQLEKLKLGKKKKTEISRQTSEGKIKIEKEIGKQTNRDKQTDRTRETKAKLPREVTERERETEN